MQRPLARVHEHFQNCEFALIRTNGEAKTFNIHHLGLLWRYANGSFKGCNALYPNQQHGLGFTV